MKHAMFMLSYGAPIAIWLILFDVADAEFSLPRFGLLGAAIVMAFMASVGFHFFEIRAQHFRWTMSEVVIRGSLAGVALIGLSLGALAIGGVRVGFYSSISLSIILAPLALLVPPRVSSHDE